MQRYIDIEDTKQEISELITREWETEHVEAEIDKAVEIIQNNIIVWKLSKELLSIMNMWMRTNWYHLDGMSKFEHCLQTIVIRESKERLFVDLLYSDDQYPDKKIREYNFHYYLSDILSDMVSMFCENMFCRRWANMEYLLENEAKDWVLEHGEHVEAGDGGHFQWYDSVNEVVCYHLPHISQPLETLPCDFQHEEDWTCPICLEVGEETTCVRTKCKHVFHEQCFKDCKRAYFNQEENDGKTSCPCPICRRDVIN